ncbi:MAG: glutamate 5-kinase, partial [Alphaproteobacteria bacterium]|nr:glutamate 5-kinase [Alphaproteobacteria bacterium]
MICCLPSALNNGPSPSMPSAVQLTQPPEWFSRARRLVIKVGSSSLIQHGRFRQSWFTSFVQDLAAWHQAGKELLVVSSGAVALGREGLGLSHRPRLLKEKQAASAIGQIKLAHAYDLGLAAHNITVAQVLPTLSDTENRQHYLNLCETLGTLLAQRVIPILNENDAVANAELRFGDNDRLAARIAQLTSADALILLSDIDGLFTADPNRDPSATHLPEVQEINQEIEAMGGGSGSTVGTGGMASKILAAKIATTAGCDMVIANASADHPLRQLIQGGRHTRFVAQQRPMAARKQWLAGSLKPAGSLT